MALERPKKSNKTQPTPRKKTKSSISYADSFNSFIKGLKSERFRISIGFILSVFVLFLFVSFVSYFFSGAADKSVFDNMTFRESLSYRQSVKNWGSVMGSYFSESLIDNSFGIASFSLLYFGIIVALRLMKVRIVPIWKSFLQTSFWLIFGSIALGYFTNLFPILRPSFFALGGNHGIYITNQLNSFIGKFGTLLFIISLLAIYLVIVWSNAIPFFRNLFVKKEKNIDEQSQLEEEPVAIGTEIVPEEWIVTSANEEEIEEFEDIEPIEVDDEKKDEVIFEIDSLKTENNNSDDENESDKAKSKQLVEQLGRYDSTLDLSKYQPPTLELLKSYGMESDLQIDMEEQKANKDRIVKTLRNFDIEIESIKATVGPTITLYEIVPKSGIRISKIRNLESDIMLSLAATGIRIIAPIPGKGTIGIEVPNNDPQIVSMHSIIRSKKFMESRYDLPIALGKTITNEIFMFDLTKMPHLLVAGATGQGKSVGLNAIITSLLYKKHPSQLKFVLIDPKKVEFNIYGSVEKHFLAKLPDGEDAIITDTTKVVHTLNSLCMEMDSRYDLLKKAHVRNIKEYNEKFADRELNPEKGHRYLPYIVVIIDEFGDLIMTAGKEVEMPIARIAQLARAVGIHMIIATQRPSVTIITGVIKANFPARVAFRVSSMIDSRTILDTPGANQLVGRGDLLFSQGSDLTRVQCAFVDTPEVEQIARFIGNQRGYPTAFYLPEYVGPENEGASPSAADLSKRDVLFEEAARMIVATQQGSTSMLQRKFSIGYNRAGRLSEQLEIAGIVGANESGKVRQVLIQTEYDLEQLLKMLP
jgi:S-DNA-T family DNA segregation ATPase FtsK/SpoIIIE